VEEKNQWSAVENSLVQLQTEKESVHLTPHADKPIRLSKENRGEREGNLTVQRTSNLSTNSKFPGPPKMTTFMNLRQKEGGN